MVFYVHLSTAPSCLLPHTSCNLLSHKGGEGSRKYKHPCWWSHTINLHHTKFVGRSQRCISRALVSGNMTSLETVLTTETKLGKSCCATGVCSAELEMNIPSCVQTLFLPAQPKKCGLRMDQNHTLRIRLFQTLGKCKCLYISFNELRNDDTAWKVVPRKFLKQH